MFRFLANVYLYKFDDYIRNLRYYKEGKIKYFRYVDDIVILYDDSTLLNISQNNLLESVLWKLLNDGLKEIDGNLMVNQAKSTYGDSIELKELYKENIELNDLSKRINRVLSTLYLLKGEYISAYNNDEADFLIKYCYFLKSIGINVDCNFLRRRIITTNRKELHIWKKFKNEYERILWIIKRRIYFFIKLPPMPKEVDMQTTAEWKYQFMKTNPEFIDELNGIKDLLKTKLLFTLDELKEIVDKSNGDDGQFIKEKISSIRFFSYRLRYFCGDDVEDALRKLIDIPLFIDSSLLIKYPDLSVDLMSIMEDQNLNIPQEQRGFIKLLLMQAAGMKDSSISIEYILNGMENDDEIKKLIGSSSLVKRSYNNNDTIAYSDNYEPICRNINHNNNNVIANELFFMRQIGIDIDNIYKNIDRSNNIIINAINTDIDINIFSQLEDITGLDPYNMPVIDPDDPYNYT